MPSDSKQRREHAVRFAKLVTSSRSADSRAYFHDFALTWFQLATELEKTRALLDEWEEFALTNSSPHRQSASRDCSTVNAKRVYGKGAPGRA